MSKKTIAILTIIGIFITGLVITYLVTKNLALVIVIFILVAGGITAFMFLKRKQAFEKVRVDIVVDGDTLMLKRENVYKHIKSRLIGLNCPEDTTEHEAFGKEATEFSKKSLLKKYVYIEKDKQKLDQYGRSLLYIWLEKPTQFSEDEIQSNLFNAILLKEGYARLFSFEPNVKYHNFFVKFEDEAKKNKKGMWALKEYQDKYIKI